jgi:hypothetical protein
MLNFYSRTLLVARRYFTANSRDPFDFDIKFYNVEFDTYFSCLMVYWLFRFATYYNGVDCIYLKNMTLWTFEAWVIIC